ncbi:MAG: DUF2306 domain-containing protein [Pseudomonadota bacterium]
MSDVAAGRPAAPRAIHRFGHAPPLSLARRIGLSTLWLLLLLGAAPFIVYAAVFGARGLVLDLSDGSRLFERGAAATNAALALHMIAGAAITLLALTQIIGPLRRRWPRLHRASGYAFAVCAALSALGGLVFIALRGTIGGPLMDGAFALYGALTLLAPVMAVRLARAGAFEAHRRWALRAVVLALGSWIYRAHYTLWHMATGGLGAEPDFTGLFDQITLFAFYLPYLALLEIWFAWERRAEARRRQSGPA